MRSIIKYMCVMGLFLFVATTAFAQEHIPRHRYMCNVPLAALMETMKSLHQEQVSTGLSDYGHLTVTFVGKDGKWTLAVVKPNKQSCVMSTGIGWTATVGRGT